MLRTLRTGALHGVSRAATRRGRGARTSGRTNVAWILAGATLLVVAGAVALVATSGPPPPSDAAAVPGSVSDAPRGDRARTTAPQQEERPESVRPPPPSRAGGPAATRTPNVPLRGANALRPGRVVRTVEPDPTSARPLSPAPEPIPGWTPTPAHAVADTWRPVVKSVVSRNLAGAVSALAPPPDAPAEDAQPGLLLRVVDDRGDGVPGAVVYVKRHGERPKQDGEFTTGPEGLVPRRFDPHGRYDVYVKTTPDAWLARPAGLEREYPWCDSSIHLDEADSGRAVEMRFRVARTARLEIEIVGATIDPHLGFSADVGVETSDGTLLRRSGSTHEGNLATLERLPAGRAYAYVNVDDVGADGAWCRLEAGLTTRMRLEPATDGTSLTVRVPLAPDGAGTFGVGLRQLLDYVGPQVHRSRSRIAREPGREVTFRGLAAGRYLVSGGFEGVDPLPPAIVRLSEGANEFVWPTWTERSITIDDPVTTDVPVRWGRRPSGGWVWPSRPLLLVFPPPAASGPWVASVRRESTVRRDLEHRDLLRAPLGPSHVLVLPPPGSWYARGSNYRFLPLDVPATAELEPDAW